VCLTVRATAVGAALQVAALFVCGRGGRTRRAASPLRQAPEVRPANVVHPPGPHPRAIYGDDPAEFRHAQRGAVFGE